MEAIFKLIPADKIKHIIVGLAVGLFALLLLVLASLVWPTFYANHPGFFAILVMGVCVHAAKEGLDRLDNLIMYHQGRPPMHGVEFLDFVAGMTGTLALALAALWVGVV